jgi:outer membrane protein insertion porin family
LTLGHYFPLLAKFIGYTHAEGGYVRENSSGTLPPYEKFFLGGINSIRGFDYEGIHLTDSDNNIIGGERYVQFNAELLHPLFTEGFLGLVFYDAGNVYGQDEHVDFTDLRRSYGFGIRWYSPIGPIRFERGYIVNPRSGEARSGKWDFTMGGVF